MKLVSAILSDNSHISSMRLMSLISLIIAGYIAIYGISTKADLNGVAMLCGVFLTAAFGGKVAQKMSEVKVTGNSITQNIDELK